MADQPPCAILPVPIALPQISSVTTTSTLNYYGPTQQLLAAEASKFLAQITGADELSIESTIHAFMHATQEDCIGEADDKTACWLTIRCTKPTDEFAVPRWHKDGCMYPYDEGREDVVRSKYGLTLLGPATLMLEPNASVSKTVKEVMEQYWLQIEAADTELSQEEQDEADTALRAMLATKLFDAARVRLGHGQVVRFSWGREDSPVHSEPDLVSDRVFMTVLYGSESELRGMCEWRGEEFGKMSMS